MSTGKLKLRKDHVPELDWDKFHSLLDKCHVILPDFAPGEAIDIYELVRYLLKVQSRRNILDRIANKLHQRLGMLKRRIDVLTAQLRIERAMASDEQGVRSRSNRFERESQVEFLTQNTTSVLAMLNAKKHQYEHAYESLQNSVKSLQFAKETLNSIKQLAISDRENSGAEV